MSRLIRMDSFGESWSRFIPTLLGVATALFLTLFINITLAEDHNTALRKIEERLHLIKYASSKFDIDYKIFCSVIYT